jgi:hypothetical protein
MVTAVAFGAILLSCALALVALFAPPSAGAAGQVAAGSSTRRMERYSAPSARAPPTSPAR